MHTFAAALLTEFVAYARSGGRNEGSLRTRIAVPLASARTNTARQRGSDLGRGLLFGGDLRKKLSAYDGVRTPVFGHTHLTAGDRPLRNDKLKQAF
jgi:hypothetical protein